MFISNVWKQCWVAMLNNSSYNEMFIRIRIMKRRLGTKMLVKSSGLHYYYHFYHTHVKNVHK